jgi:hypothetical protein
MQTILATKLPLLGSNQDSPDPESGVLPVTPRGIHDWNPNFSHPGTSQQPFGIATEAPILIMMQIPQMANDPATHPGRDIAAAIETFRALPADLLSEGTDKSADGIVRFCRARRVGRSNPLGHGRV